MKSKILGTIASLAAASSLAFSGVAHAAGTAAFALSATSGSYNINENVAVSIYENGTGINAVTANFSYDTGKLQLTGIDASGSAFAGDAGTYGSSVNRFVPAGATVSGNVKVATLTFKAIANGTASITVGTSGSMIVGPNASNVGTDYWNGSAVSGSYTVITPTPTPVTSTPTPTSSSTSTSKASSSTSTKSAAQSANTGATSTKSSDSSADTTKVGNATKDAASSTPKNLTVSKASSSDSDNSVRNAVLTGLGVLLVGLVVLRTLAKHRTEATAEAAAAAAVAAAKATKVAKQKKSAAKS